MKRVCCIALLLTYICNSETAVVNITGIITQHDNTPLKEVTILLSGVPTLSTKTDSDGKFNLHTPVNVINTNLSESVPFNYHFKGRTLFYSSTSKISNGNITIFAGNGTKLFSKDVLKLNSTKQQLSIPSHTSGLSILKIL